MTRSFDHRDLRGQDFSGQDLAGASFIGCSLAGVSFRSTDLSEALFQRCKAFDGDREEEDGGSVDFSFANLREAMFERCDLTTSRFCNASAYDLKFVDCQLAGADLSTCDFCLPIRGASTLSSFTMTGCNFSFGDLSNTYLKDCILTGNRMIDCLMNNCVLAGADLSGSDLSGLTGSSLDLTGADLRGAVFNTLDPRLMSLAGVRMGLTQGLQILDKLEILIDPEAD